ncbi:uracil-DNA glycosylase family protein [Sphaerochaeta sp.]|jgi:single-strand selective monofunctional uracil DNA glycosylase|uniref:uracil-DNA glycosylase family protein n=1 Tax=Sphaerochaeta sp. TaxID=1972642 RepID=UPI00258A35CD|nr:uracil-DNA glycosylase family protein [Sphaerochaeta sp.]MDD3422979.1 single-stranded DNA-binding protein [Sphaerochaeta sp.]MDD3455796.1 single-stranded DNA-binding protein [Sphaerochaeta sp.]MDD4037468.1 single-stranded DNA-binding protein [Sphaerochaeta sp.]MDX9983097.1 single-stranded DNA-binding protein [Sphaerochaeta sp.]
MLTLQEKVIERTKVFAQQVETLRFSCDCYIYNPLSYAWPMHELYIRNYLSRPVRILLLGMNPGPFGMTQTGVPFGEIEAVKHFLKLEAEIAKPLVEHPARPVLGLASPRSEVSGRRLWGLLAEHYGTAEAFSSEMAVTNYCPLVFMDRKPSAKNITPDMLARGERLALETICDRYLLDVIELLEPTYLIGVGKYAMQKFVNVAGSRADTVISSILHPSPASPQANRGWKEKVAEQLCSIGAWT